MIHVAEFNSGQIRIEISNQDEFIRQVKKTAREVRRKKLHGEWRIRLIGGERINAPVQQLIDQLSISTELEKTARRTGETEAEILAAAKEEIDSAAPVEPTQSANGKPVRPRPGGPLT